MKLINYYLTERNQSVKLNHQFSSWMDNLFGAPKGPILRALLFKIFSSDIILFQKKNASFVSYADDKTSYCLGKSSKVVITKLEASSRTFFKWFENNNIEANPDKYHRFVGKQGVFLPILVNTKFLIQKMRNSWDSLSIID